jgi:sulfate/thiosulfate transport system permease protein
MLSNQPPDKTRPILIAIAVGYLALILLAPAVNVFWQAFHEGLGPFFHTFAEADFTSAVGLTLLVACVVVPINTVFGLCAAWAIARNRFWGRSLVISLLDLPFSISPVVAGVMMVLLYGNRGWFGSWLSAIGVKIIFGVPGIIIATAFVTLPFVAREVIPVLEEIGPEQEEAARTLGASDWQIFWRVTLPNIRWGLLYGVILTNARAMGEFGAVSVVCPQDADITAVCRGSLQAIRHDCRICRSGVISDVRRGDVGVEGRIGETVGEKGKGRIIPNSEGASADQRP